MSSYTVNLEAEPMTTSRDAPEYSTAVQILSIIFFGAFSITAVVIALNVFWPAGFALGAIIAWRGGFLPPSASNQTTAEEIAMRIRELSPEGAPTRTSGNASFDAYRSDMISRLEEEQDNFEAFLGRLRDAKDRSEFERFMDERAEVIEAERAEQR